jgi:hypothetical protein
LPVLRHRGVVRSRHDACRERFDGARVNSASAVGVHRLPTRDPRCRPVESPDQKEIDMRKLLACLMLACFALGSTAGFAQVPEKCKNLKGDEQKKCIDDAKSMKK